MKTIYDFIILWIYYGDRIEAWQDAKFINNKAMQKRLTKLIKSAIKEKITCERTECGLLHTPDFSGKCFHCGKQVFDR